MAAVAAGFVLIVLIWKKRAALAPVLRRMTHLLQKLVGSFWNPEVLTHSPIVGPTTIDRVLGWSKSNCDQTSAQKHTTLVASYQTCWLAKACNLPLLLFQAYMVQFCHTLYLWVLVGLAEVLSNIVPEVLFPQLAEELEVLLTTSTILH